MVTHFTKTGSRNSVCINGPKRVRVTTDPKQVTCKTCLKMLAARQLVIDVVSSLAQPTNVK